MNSIHQLLPLPYELINHILSFCEDDLVCHHYHLNSGTFTQHINWKSERIDEIKSTLRIHRFFPYYLLSSQDPDHRYIYQYLKGYFREHIITIT
jgi:hypothetical protein